MGRIHILADQVANQIAAVVLNDPLRDELHRNALEEYHTLSWDKVSDHVHSLYQSHLIGATA